jgi:SNF2 family DNA or RNA helicase
MTTIQASTPTMQLRSFQEELVQKHVSIHNSLIGDDMGLGKTVEGVTIDARKRELFSEDFRVRHKGKPLTLVVAPKGVMGAWIKHYKNWAPHLRTFQIDTKNRSAFLEAVSKGAADVFVCHWEALRLIPELSNVYWFHVIGDEIHRIKNRKAKITNALKRLWTEHKLGLSGTPADNKPQDFWSILNWLYPRVFSSYNRFENEHVLVRRHNAGYCLAKDCVTPSGAERWHERGYSETVGVANVDVLMSQIGGFYTRRLKDDVWHDMPAKYWTDLWVDLTPQQRRAYDSMKDRMIAWVGKHENEPIAAPVVISQLMRLQQFAGAHGRIEVVTKRYKNCTLDECVDKPQCQGHQVEVLKLEEPSSKLDALMELIEDNPEQKFVVFSQSKQMIYLFKQRLDTAKVSAAVYTGDVHSEKTRDKLVDDFQDGKYRIFAATIRSGGEGITLTAANTIVFIDCDWSPSKNRQAEDRCHRIGQFNAVQVIRLLARGTIEPKRTRQIELKWSWLKELLGDDPGKVWAPDEDED